ncbi:hypothetical protein CYLTODRAFT_14718 [Cylindrobasidium torrendii FP15055 ss-10]|uniref:Uncharacterized protein n=1 Tax=Cylindrobasidium torrendii FP15055 ss-10 TaxID=1314674 RepID=A0A0D7BAD5_9AGAR|nr:hypothetical protein CYLTODRAFT_14718 [Cylindrobasidium torrendii FP15055 ss-10]
MPARPKVYTHSATPSYSSSGIAQSGTAASKPTTTSCITNAAPPQNPPSLHVRFPPAADAPARHRKNISDIELAILFDILVDVKPHGPNMWKVVHERYNERATESGFPKRELSTFAEEVKQAREGGGW